MRHHTLQDLDAHDGCGQIVDDGTQKEGQRASARKQSSKTARPKKPNPPISHKILSGRAANHRHQAVRIAVCSPHDETCHNRETIHVVDGLNNPHCREQEKNHGPDVIQAFGKLLAATTAGKCMSKPRAAKAVMFLRVMLC